MATDDEPTEQPGEWDRLWMHLDAIEHNHTTKAAILFSMAVREYESAVEEDGQHDIGWTNFARESVDRMADVLARRKSGRE